MKQSLRDICEREIERINAISEQKPLERDDIEKLKSLATALKTLEDAKAPDRDALGDLMRVTTSEQLNEILDRLDYGHK